MELRQLEYFVAVAEERSFTRAAERVHVAQPGVSAQIRQLEREVGEALFERTSRGARLTGAGVTALEHARVALAAAESLRGSVAELTGVVRGHVAIGTISGGRGIDLAGLLSSFRRRHPDVEITLAEGVSASLLERVRDGSVQLGLVGRSERALPSGVAATTVRDERLVVVVAPGHPLAARRRVQVAELVGHTLICLPAGTGTRDALDDAAARAGVRLAVALEPTEPLVTTELARQELGVGVVPESVGEYLAGRVHTLALVGPVARTRLELVWGVDRDANVRGGPAARALVAHAQQFVART